MNNKQATSFVVPFFGSTVAIYISWSVNHSIFWAILHGLFGWFYVIYYAIVR